MRSTSARTLISTVRSLVAACSRMGRSRSLSRAAKPPGLGREAYRETSDPCGLLSSVNGSGATVLPTLLILPPPCQFVHQLLLEVCEVVEDPGLVRVELLVVLLDLDAETHPEDETGLVEDAEEGVGLVLGEG